VAGGGGPGACSTLTRRRATMLRFGRHEGQLRRAQGVGDGRTPSGGGRRTELAAAPSGGDSGREYEIESRASYWRDYNAC
jgi:hypothetical protein